MHNSLRINKENAFYIHILKYIEMLIMCQNREPNQAALQSEVGIGETSNIQFVKHKLYGTYSLTWHYLGGFYYS